MNHDNNSLNDLGQTQQRLRVREQEINALKLQNRHLIAKLEEAEKNSQPNQINTHEVAEEVQKNLKPVLAEIEKSLKNAFDMLQSTMRGIYQQSSRAQQAVEDMTNHTRGIQNHMQDNVQVTMSNFCDRLERQIASRLNGIDVMVQKQNEMLRDVQDLKNALNAVQRNSENQRHDLNQLRDLPLVIERIQAEKAEEKRIASEAKNYIQNETRNLENVNPPNLNIGQENVNSTSALNSDDDYRLADEAIHVIELNDQNGPA